MKNLCRLRGLHIILILCCLVSVVSCRGGEGKNGIHADVLLYWPTDEYDPTYREWTETARKELRRQGIYGNVEVYFAHSTERWEVIERPMLNDLIHRLRTEGRMPDLILSYGDVNRWLLTTNVDPVIASIPVVCFGLHMDDFLPEQYDLLINDYREGRWDIVDILEDFHLQENLEMANAFAPYIFDHVRDKYSRSMASNRLVTLLDVEYLWVDRLRFNQLRSQMQELDQDLFFDNLLSRVSDDHVRRQALAGKIVFSCRSLMTPSWNADMGQAPTAWAFYPQKSSNVFLQTKHDNKTRLLVEGPSFAPYCTMVAEDYLINDKCIGGWFSTFETQVRDAVSVGIRLLEGESALEIGMQKHSVSCNLNWDVVRQFGLDVNLVPDFVHIDNVRYSDRNPEGYRALMVSLKVILAIILIWSAFVIFVLARRSVRNSRRLRAYATETIRNRAMLRHMMDTIDFRVWEDECGDVSGLGRVQTSDFFRDKLKDFAGISRPGQYSLQIHASIDGQPEHWYMLLMNVIEAPDSSLLRRGVIINYDNHKKLEAVAAQTNRILTATKTREGFIASMNHEIRTPLNSIVGYTQLMSMCGDNMEDEELSEYADAIRTNAYILKNTINNMLTASRIEKADINPELERINLTDYILSRRETGKGIDRLSSHRIVLKPGPSDLEVMVDCRLLSMVLENLAVNAARFSEESQDIEFGWNRSSESGWAAELWIKDCGIGIAPEHQELIFDRFFKVDSFSSGCGLGLYICRSVLGLMNAAISVESKPGEGSLFRIKLAS